MPGVRAVSRPVSLTVMHYLVVDDETRLTDLVVRYLSESGHTAEGRYDGPSGLAAARDPRLDAVVLDVMLPAWTASRCAAPCAVRASTSP